MKKTITALYTRLIRARIKRTAADMHPNPNQRVQTIDAHRLTYLYYSGTGPPLLLMHANGFQPWLWHPVARRLAPHYTIIAPYFCDHRIVEPEEGLQWKLLAQDLFRFCRELKLERPLVAGHSMGATVATMAEALFGLNAAAMVLIEPIFLPPALYHPPHAPETAPLVEKALKRRNRWEDPADARAYLKSKPLFADWDEEALNLYIDHGMVTDGEGGLRLACAPAREAALFAGDRHYDPWPELPRVTCPVLILGGGKSDLRNFIDLREAASRFPSGRYQLVPDAGHLIPMEQPGATARIIHDYFAERDEDPAVSSG